MELIGNEILQLAKLGFNKNKDIYIDVKSIAEYVNTLYPEFGSKNIDGGAPDSVYLTSQKVDGGEI